MTDERSRLRLAMSEAACLPPEDPLRQQVEAEIARQGEWAEKEWLELLAQDERFRIGLRKAEVPDKLEQTLLMIPESGLPLTRLSPPGGGRAGAVPTSSEQSRVKGLQKTGSKKMLLMAAAAIAVAFLVIAFFMFKKTDDNQLDTIITLATNDHLNDRHLKVETADCQEFCQELQPQLPFEVITPELGLGFRLVGGRPCKIGTHPIVYSLWRSSGNEYSLFQFQLADYGLQESDSPRLVKPKNSVMEKSPCEVLYWTKNGFGFVLVADHGELLKGIRPK